MRKNKKKQVWQVETGLTHPILWMSGKSNNVEAASRVYFPLPDLSRKIERDSARRVFTSQICRKRERNVQKWKIHLQSVQSYCFFSLNLWRFSCRRVVDLKLPNVSDTLVSLLIQTYLGRIISHLFLPKSANHCLGPSCLEKFGKNFGSAKTCPSFDSFETL